MEALRTFFILLTIIVVRYFLFSAGIYYFTAVLFKGRWRARRLHDKPPSSRQIKREIFWSLLSCGIFAGVGTGGWWCWAHGYSQVYLKISDYGVPYLVLSLPLLLLLQDAYFYFVHRLMHHPLFFKRVHLAHHESTHPSPFASFSFHPFEAGLEALILPLLVVCVPTHPAVILAFLTTMSWFGVVNHTGYEFYPRAFGENTWLKQWLTTTHHEMHHTHYRWNYGLYFTFWDKWLGTEHPEYEARFAEVKAKLQSAPKADETSGLPSLVGSVLHRAHPEPEG